MKHAVTKDGYITSIAVLRDDTILIGCQKDSLLTIDLYTPQLEFVRTVLTNFKIKSCTYCLAEFQTGEIAFPDNSNLYVFRKNHNLA